MTNEIKLNKKQAEFVLEYWGARMEEYDYDFVPDDEQLKWILKAVKEWNKGERKVHHWYDDLSPPLKKDVRKYFTNRKYGDVDHEGCFSYPNCDLSPTGCFHSGLSYDEMDHFGHRD